MGDRQQRGQPAHREETPGGSAMKPQDRWAILANHLDVSPADAVTVARAERLHCGFLGGEAPREMDGRGMSSPAVRDLLVREHSVEEPFAMPLDDVGNATDIRGVEPEPDDLRHAPSA